MLNPDKNKSFCHRISGFTLVELMLAMLIGIIILGGIFSLFTTTRNTQRTSEDQLRLISDARFAIDAMAYDLRHAGSFGSNNVWESVLCNVDDADCAATLPVTATGDCAAHWYLDFRNQVFASQGVNPFSGTCATQGFQANTDVLGVHYADSSPIVAAPLIASKIADGVAYVRSNVQTGQAFIGGGGAGWLDLGQFKFDEAGELEGVTRNHRLVAHLYYVSPDSYVPGDGIPSLRRATLGPGPQFNDAVFITGVVDMQLEFGVDLNTTRDGIIDSFVNSTGIPVYPGSSPYAGAPNWSRVYAVKVWLLMRTARTDRDGIAETRDFKLAGNLATPIDNAYRHYMISSLVRLRNTR